jgi:hypothetical protein
MYKKVTGLMTIEEYAELLAYIYEKHDFVFSKGNSKHIKYVDCTFDTRTYGIFSVTLRGMFNGATKNFSITNENRNRNLKEWIYNWLEDKE